MVYPPYFIVRTPTLCVCEGLFWKGRLITCACMQVPSSTYSRLHLSTLCNMEPVHLDEFYATPQQPGPDFRSFGEEHIQVLLKVNT